MVWHAIASPITPASPFRTIATGPIPGPAPTPISRFCSSRPGEVSVGRGDGPVFTPNLRPTKTVVSGDGVRPVYVDDGSDCMAGDYDSILIVGFGGPERPDDVISFLENVT